MTAALPQPVADLVTQGQQHGGWAAPEWEMEWLKLAREGNIDSVAQRW